MLGFQGEQERSVPVTNGCSPVAPAGGHSTQAGTLVEGEEVALPDAPPEVVEDDALEALDDALVARAADVGVVTAEREAAPAVVVPAVLVPAAAVLAAVVPAVVVPAVAADVGWIVVTGATVAPLTAAVTPLVALPSVTTPPFTTLDGFTVVCAHASAVAIVNISIAQMRALLIAQTKMIPLRRRRQW